jgi:hypothetical protein
LYIDIAVAVAILLSMSTVIVGFGLSALFLLRRHRLLSSIDRIQQYMAVGQLITNDPDFITKFIVTVFAKSKSADIGVIFETLYDPSERNLIEAAVFYHLHPEFTLQQAVDAVLADIEAYDRNGLRWVLWL